MHHFRLTDFHLSSEFNAIDKAFLDTKPIEVMSWQGQNVSDRPQGTTRELLHTTIEYIMPMSPLTAQKQLLPNLPWAEDHFAERVSGEPLNPPPSNKIWPFQQAGHAEHIDADGKFSHTYPERMWPKRAGDTDDGDPRYYDNRGIRFAYGDLEDVVQQLKKDPSTRQAYLPIWFPEDTGATEGQRVPCTLGYHFIIRGGMLHITYYIRSCDYMRHFRDDLYMATRLAQWMVDRYNEDAALGESLAIGTCVMHIVSFHIFEGDIAMLEWRTGDYVRKHGTSGGFNLSGML